MGGHFEEKVSQLNVTQSKNHAKWPLRMHWDFVLNGLQQLMNLLSVWTVNSIYISTTLSQNIDTKCNFLTTQLWPFFFFRSKTVKQVQSQSAGWSIKRSRWTTIFEIKERHKITVTRRHSKYANLNELIQKKYCNPNVNTNFRHLLTLASSFSFNYYIWFFYGYFPIS